MVAYARTDDTQNGGVMRIMYVLACAGIVQFCSGFIYEVRILKKWDNRTKKYIIALSDFHDKTHTATATQHAYLEQIIAQCSKNSTKIIVEDLSSPAYNGRNACGPFVINSRGGILGGLAQRYEQQGLTVDNVEYRYCRVASLGPVINNIEQVAMPFQSTNSISVGVLLQEIEDNIKEINTFNDGATFNALYKNIVRAVKKELVSLNLHQMRQVSVAQYMHTNSTPKNRLTMLNTLLTVDSTLLDIKIMHSIIQAPETTIIALAGGSHAIRVCNWLVQHGGYQHHYATPINYGREYNLLNCVGANIMEGGYCMRPEPVDLGVVMQYLPK